jgi:hypothetical protein
MSRTFVRASSQYLESTAPPLTDISGPLSMSCWYRPSSIENGTALSIGTSTSESNYMALGMEPTGKAFLEAAGVDSLSAGTLSSGAWAHLGGVVASATSRLVYLNGTAGTVNATSKTGTGMNRCNIGCLFLGASSRVSFAGGEIAECAMWNVALAASEVLALAKGLHPFFVRPASLVFFCPIGIGSPEPDLRKATNMTLGGTPALSTASPPILQRGYTPTIPVPTVVEEAVRRRFLMMG